MHEVVEKVLVSQDEIIHKCAELGAKITSDYKALNEVPYVVGLLKGSVPFMAEIIKHIDLDIQIDFMDVSSYQGTESIGDIRIDKDLDCSVKGLSILLVEDIRIDKDLDCSVQGLSILLVEDIVDTGRTLKEVKRTLMNKGAKDVKVVSLLDKPDRRVVDIEAEYVGFAIPNEFVIGYGLDYDQKYRNLPYIGVLKREIYE